MTHPSALDNRLAELGITIPGVAKPVASYIPAITTGNLVFTSGQLPFIEGVLPQTGKVGAEVSAAKGVIGSLDRITRVVKVVGFVASDPSFTGQPGVINGASDLLGEIFGDAGVHARSAVGIAVLPLDSPVEIEFIFEYA
jgi:enamine deaminase RidA (YjgF/YER057c/UK114 family)